MVAFGSLQIFLIPFHFVLQVLYLLEVVINNAASQVDCPPHSVQITNNSDIEFVDGTPYQTQVEPSTLEQGHIPDNNQSRDVEVPPSCAKLDVNVHAILTQLPDAELHNLCNILALEGLVFALPFYFIYLILDSFYK
jgi:hypothetical protein